MLSCHAREYKTLLIATTSVLLLEQMIHTPQLYLTPFLSFFPFGPLPPPSLLSPPIPFQPIPSHSLPPPPPHSLPTPPLPSPPFSSLDLKGDLDEYLPSQPKKTLSINPAVRAAISSTAAMVQQGPIPKPLQTTKSEASNLCKQLQCFWVSCPDGVCSH